MLAIPGVKLLPASQPEIRREIDHDHARLVEFRDNSRRGAMGERREGRVHPARQGGRIHGFEAQVRETPQGGERLPQRLARPLLGRHGDQLELRMAQHDPHEFQARVSAGSDDRDFHARLRGRYPIAGFLTLKETGGLGGLPLINPIGSHHRSNAPSTTLDGEHACWRTSDLLDQTLEPVLT